MQGTDEEGLDIRETGAGLMVFEGWVAEEEEEEEEEEADVEARGGGRRGSGTVSSPSS